MGRKMLLAALLPVAGLCGEAILGASGVLRLAQPAVEISGALHTADWAQSIQAGGTAAPDAQGACVFELRVSDQQQVAGTATVTPGPDGAVRAVYAFTPKQEMTLASLYVGFRLPVAALRGASWRVGDRTGNFPETRGSTLLFSGSAREWELTFPGPEPRRLRVTFDAPTPLLIQDDRQWGETFSFRMGHNGERRYAANVSNVVAFTLATHAPLTLVYDRPVTLRADDEWIALDYRKEIEPGSALDFSVMGLVDAPAGKHGWLRAVGPHFEFENRPGVPQRFYGVNFNFSANFPSAAQAEQIAARLVRLGYNSVRIHHHDQGCVQGSADGQTLNPEQMARLDGFIAACIQRGLYVTTDLYISRHVTWRQIGIERDDPMDKQIFKALIAVHEPAYQNWATFARAFLNHVNPHTGRRYADEPGMPLLAMINEGSIGYGMRAARETQPMQEAWRVWREAKRAANPAFAELPERLPLSTGGRDGAAVALFIAEIEARMVARMRAFLRDEIGSRALISNYNCGPHYLTLQQTRADLYDYVDDHFYVDHPHFLERSWALPSRSDNVNPVRDYARRPAGVAFTRLVDKPFTVTEFNFSAPGMFRGVGGILTGALGALQDWNGIWRFAYSHRLEYMFDGQGAMNYFDVATDPLGQASDRASICLFLRGDLDPAAEQAVILLTPQELRAWRDAPTQVAPAWSGAAWHMRVGTRVADAAPAGERSIPLADAYAADAAQKFASFTNTPGRLVLDPARGAFTLDTARTCGGFAEAGLFTAGPLRVTVVDTPATVWVSSLDHRPVTTSRRLLLTHLTDVQNTGTRFAERARQTLLARGSLPHLVRAGRAEISLALNEPGAYTVYALATDGRRLEQVAARTQEGRLAFTASVAGPDGARMLYEIVRAD